MRLEVNYSSCMPKDDEIVIRTNEFNVLFKLKKNHQNIDFVPSMDKFAILASMSKDVILKKCYIKQGIIDVPEGITVIDSMVFADLDMVTVNIPNTVVEIGENAFANSTMQFIKMPDSIKKIGSSAFRNCQKLKSVLLSNQILVVQQYLFFNCKNLFEVVLPNKLIEIEKSAFENCYSLNKLDFPNTLYAVNSTAFEHTPIIYIYV